MTTLANKTSLVAKPLLKIGVGATILLLFFGTVVSANSGVSQGYTTKTSNVTAGALMGLSPSTNNAELASSGEKYQLLGLVADKPLIALSDGSNQVQVVISGPASALVSNINGDIKAGDKITSSPIVGVGMKATDAGQVVGTAQVDFSKLKSVEQAVTDKSGQKHTVLVGSIPLLVSVSYFSGEANSLGALSSILPPFLLEAANSVAGQPVSPLRVFIGLIALLFGFVVVGIMLQSAVRSGMISVGRNPLAKKAVRRQLFDICLTALGILVVTTIVVYVVLKI